MRVFHDIYSYLVEKETCITTGTFDGIHIGHRKILSQLVDMAALEDKRSVLLTFHPHPRKVLFPDDNGLKLLNTLDEKLALLEKTGIDDVIVHPFSLEFSRTTALYYVRDLLVGKLNMKKLVIGYDHQFGRNREGSIEQLKEIAPLYDFQVTEIPAQDIDDVKVSSTKIRAAIEGGELATAADYLDYNYFISGRVIHGAKRGRNLGFPTANIRVEDENKLIPKEGVYAVKVMLNDRAFGGMLNIGYNPTVSSGNEQSIEVHLFDFSEQIYDADIKVEFVKRLRNEKRFEGVDDLILQLNQDQKDAKSALL